MRKRGEHSSENGSRERPYYFGANAVTPEDRQETCDDRRNRHELGTQTEQRSFHHRFAQNRDRKRALLFFLSRNCFFEVNHHNDSGLHGGAKERNEADPHGNREGVPKQPKQVEPARKRD